MTLARNVVALIRDVLLVIVLAGGIYVFARAGQGEPQQPEDCSVTARYYGRC